jgi:phenylacetate-CoA ligase
MNLRGILTWGELLDPGTREFLEARFDAEVYDGYGAVEVAPLGGLAWECRSHGFHINADCVILEFLRDGEPVAPGERGEVVATSLFRYAMPAIRYALNDYAVRGEESCSCGRGLPLIKALEGRKVDCLIAEDDELVSPFRIILALQEIQQVGQYQVIQERRDQLIVNIASKDPIPEEDRARIRATCWSLVGKGVAVRVNAVTSIPKAPGKKFQPVICEVQGP